MAALAAAIRARRVILFAGAGLSMTVGLPSWDRLIAHLADELDLAPDPEASHLALAEYYRLEKGGLDPLVAWMTETWRVPDAAVRRSRAHALIVGLDFPVIYTTNYDANLEAAFRLVGRPHTRIVSPGDLAAAPAGATPIVKFHGDFSAPASLVLTETDYFDRLDFESPLDLKFRADALDHTLLFVGYSMSDLNIRLLLYRLANLWRRAGMAHERPRSFIFMPRACPMQAALLDQWGLSLIDGTGDDPEVALVAFLEELAGNRAEARAFAG